MAFSTKSREEIEALKTDWLNDGICDLENSEGFEAHREELLSFRKEIEAQRADRYGLKRTAEALKRHDLVVDINESLGLNNLMLAEHLLAMQDRADNHARLLELLHGFAGEVSDSLLDELNKNDAWAAIYEELKAFNVGVRFI